MEQKATSSLLTSSCDEFDSLYDMLEEIGRGGFSVVYKCRQKYTGEIYAVKTIDLRPLRFRENFNPKRIRREVEIMKGLSHPNVIRFIHVFETENRLLVVMEYAPGRELFDMILEKNKLTEDEAKPIFYQIASALSYLHSMGIIHRDIKPENILVLHELDPLTNIPIIKILDFGLSKQTGGGSIAKTFVGTPCYLAPEVEQTSLSNGSSYDIPADCWSLGAVLYVMLVAHFPEFDRNVGRMGRIVLRLPSHLWRDISSEAKHIVQGLLCYEVDVRLTAVDAMQHHWIGRANELVLKSKYYSMHPRNVPTKKSQVMDLVTTKPEPLRFFSGPPITISQQLHQSLPPQHEIPASYFQSKNIIASSQELQTEYGNGSEMISGSPDLYLRIAPLLTLQKQALECFRHAETVYANHPDIASHIRNASLRCRIQLQDSVNLLRKIEQTSASALDVIPEMEFALEHGETQLIAGLLGTIKTWVTDLTNLVTNSQKDNEETIQYLHRAIHSSDHLQLTAANLHASGPIVVDSSKVVDEIRRVVSELENRMDSQGMSDQDILELFSNLFGQENWRERGIIFSPSGSVNSRRHNHPGHASPSSTRSSEVEETIVGTGSPENKVPQQIEARRLDDIISVINVLRQVTFII